MANINSMTNIEKRSTFALASIFSLRMFGLFMILPIFTLYAGSLTGSSPMAIGVAIGIYGLSSGLLQAPMGWLSDRFGRKTIIVLGLLIFALGSLIAAMSSSIEGVIIGRILQGMGAVGSTILALLADLTREEVRTKAMAVIGMIIGLSFAVSMVLGPVLSVYFNLAGIFYLTFALALVGILVVLFVVPKPQSNHFHRDQEVVFSDIGKLFKNKALRRLNLSIFTLHALLTAVFVVMPISMMETLKLTVNKQWLVYLPVLLLSFIIMLPLVVTAEKNRKMKKVLTGCILSFVVAFLMFYLSDNHSLLFIISLLIFFTAFTTLEALVPSWVSKVAPLEVRGTAMGFYSSSQFFGAFVGGIVGGFMLSHHFYGTFYLFACAVSVWWFINMMSIDSPPYLSNRAYHVGVIDQAKAQSIRKNILTINGVVEAIVVPEDQAAYVKVDLKVLGNDGLIQEALEGIIHESV